MKNKCILILFYLIFSCKNDNYKGYVYDLNHEPLKDVEVYNVDNKQITITNEAGYFELNKNENSSNKLVFKKNGFATDTICSIEIQNGEQQKERFNGEAIFLLNKKDKDSIYRINEYNLK